MGNSKKLQMVVSGTVILIIIRILCNRVNNLTSIIACINIFALDFVLIIIYNEIFALAKQNIHSKKDFNFLKKQKLAKLNWITPISFLFVVVLSIFYPLWFKTDLGNDIIAIITLGLSMSDKELIAFISNKISK